MSHRVNLLKNEINLYRDDLIKGSRYNFEKNQNHSN